MKKKMILVMFLGVYLLTLAGGFVYAKSSSPAPQPTSSPLQPQTSWVLVHIDDLTSANPRLVSIWIMFTSFSPEPHIYFKSIFSTEWKNPQGSPIYQKFSVNSDRNLNPQFLEELNGLNIQRSGLVLLDNEGFQNFTSWFSALSPSSHQNLEINSAGLQSYSLTSEVQAYQQICGTLQSHNAGQTIILNWQDLSPYHFIPHPDRTDFVNLWNNLISSSFIKSCKVLPGS